MVIGLEILVEHFTEQRPGLLQLVLLILHRYAGSMIVVEDFAPGVEQFDDPVLNATEAFFPLRFIRKRLLPDALEECIEKPSLQPCTNARDQFSSLRRCQLGHDVTGQPHEGASKSTVERPG